MKYINFIYIYIYSTLFYLFFFEELGSFLISPINYYSYILNERLYLKKIYLNLNVQ